MNPVSSPPSILMVANYYPDKGAISALVKNLAHGLASEGYNVRIHSVGGFWPVRLYRYLVLLVIARNFTIIHCHCSKRLGFLPAIGTLIAGKIQRNKLVLTYHSSPTTKSFIEDSWMTRLAIDHYSIVTTPFQGTANLFKIHGVKTRAIPNIFRPENWLYQERDRFEPKLVWTRNTYYPELAVNTLEKLQTNIPEATLTMCGRAATSNRMCKYRDTPGLQLLGFVPRSQLADVLDQCDVYINTMSTDSFGYSVYEAISKGLAVVSVSSESMESLIGPEVITFSKDNTPLSLAESVQTILVDQDVTKRKVALGRKVIDQFTWVNIYPQWQTVYKSVLQQSYRDN